MSANEYAGEKDFTLANLETWLNQIEAISNRKLKDVRRNEVAEKTVGEVHRTERKPATRLKVQMGHVPPVGADPIEGEAYVLGQPTGVTVSRT